MPTHTLNFCEDDWCKLTFGGHHTITLSPDGQLLALAIGDGKTLEISSGETGISLAIPISLYHQELTHTVMSVLSLLQIKAMSG